MAKPTYDIAPMVTWGTQLLKTKDHPSDLKGRGKTIGLHVGEPLEVTGTDPVAETEQLRAITESERSAGWTASSAAGATAPSQGALGKCTRPPPESENGGGVGGCHSARKLATS